jgi:hypothetical protein
MAGQIALDTKYYPADFNLTTVLLPLSMTTGGAIAIFPLLYADRAMVIDSVRIYFPTAVGNGDGDTTDTYTMALYEVTNSAVATGTASSTQILVSNTFTVAESATFPLVQNVPLRTTGTTANNIISAGSTLWLHGSSAFTAGMAQAPMVSIRWRSQL